MAGLKNVPLELIKENPEAIRAVNRQGEDYLGIVESIKSKGFRGTITVRETKEGEETFYVIVDGMHRYMAAKDAGIDEIPCDVCDLDDAEAIEFSIMGNVHRKDTTASEYRTGVLKLLNLNPMMTEAELATKLGKSPTWIGNILRLNKIESEDIMALIDKGDIPMSNAYALAKLPPEEQMNFITEAQTLSPDEFIPKVSERAKEIRDAKRSGNDPEKPEFKPAEFMQKMKDIKEQRDSGDVAEALIAETGVKSPKDGFILALNWVLHADPFSISEQKSKWEAKEAAKAEKAKKREAEKAAKKKAEAEKKLKEAADAEAKAKEAAGA